MCHWELLDTEQDRPRLHGLECKHLLMVISVSSLLQMVPDPDPPPEGEYWHRAAGAASGREERWHPGKAE